MKQQLLVVVGGGAAGFFCACNAARLQPGLKVLLLEKSNKLLSKVRISGGGRCNLTHHCQSVADLLKNYPRGSKFLKAAFHQFSNTDTVDWFTSRGVAVKTEADGRMFPVSDNSESVIRCLLDEAQRYGVEWQLNTGVQQITPREANGEAPSFDLLLSNGDIVTANYLCIASGGFPKLEQFAWLKSTGHTVEPPIPSLFTFNLPNHPIKALMGITVPAVQLKLMGTKWQQTGPLLITHWGFSGPAALKLSAWAARDLANGQYEAKLLVNWLPGEHEQSLQTKFAGWRFSKAAQQMGGRNPLGLPNRLWDFFLQQAGIPENKRWADLPAKERNLLIRLLCNSEFNMKGKTTFKEEFVTAGGVSLAEINPQTMESRRCPGLFFAGEVMDVDAVTGGFNFQHAWTSGWIAAQTIADYFAQQQAN